MSFTDPVRLWLFVVLALVAIAYIVSQARRGRYALAFSDASLLDAIAPRRPGWRRHLVAVTFLGISAMMILAVAGPVTQREVPRERAIVILTIDTSLSMGAEDVEPTRIGAAQQAAREFLENAPAGIDVGLVSFNEVPIVEVPPTPDRTTVEFALDGLELGPFTNTGDAISTSLSTLGRTLDALEIQSDDAPPAVVVLLSDGEPTVGRPIGTAIAEAVQAGIPISTVALGTALGEVTIEDPEAPGTFITVPVPVDEDELENIAEQTGGTFFSTSSAEELAAVYDDIGTAVGFETVDDDVSDWFVAAALGLALVTSALSLLWFQRLP
ncbi:MAG: VWA domain-containing protein [Actinomycetota bacterium]